VFSCIDIGDWLLFALDTDGFVIPSLVIEDVDKTNDDAPTVEASKPPSPKVSLQLILRVL
jgi:hypothetical protein